MSVHFDECLRATPSVSSAIIVAATVVATMACERETRYIQDSPPPGIARTQPHAGNHAGGGSLPASDTVHRVVAYSVYENNAYSISEGKRLFEWMNCVGCHSNGGGGSGPALMDDTWIYGSEPQNIYETIVDGRINGMPSFAERLTPQQVWQLVVYVRTLSGLGQKAARSGRTDHMLTVFSEQRRKPHDRPQAAATRGAKRE
jgi:cytochrome c oxidase cbb3-type subunit 3